MTLDGLLHQVSSKKAILAARRGALAAAKKEVRAGSSRCAPLPCMQTLTTARSPSPQARAGSSPVATPPHVPVSAPHVPVSAPHMPSAPVVAAPLDRLAAKKAVLAAKRESKRDVHASAKHEVADTEFRHNATPQPPLKLLAG